jgi:hypothetical protein
VLLATVSIMVVACTTTEAPSETGAGGAGGGPPGAEEPCLSDGSACAGEGVCEVYACGGPTAVYNHFGCRRRSCGRDADCAAGDACYARAYGADCLPSSVDCSGGDAVCACAVSDDCGGVVDAHCLPVAFYPKSSQCETALPCELLSPRIAALELAESHHAQLGNTALAAELQSCIDALGALLRACPP